MNLMKILSLLLLVPLLTKLNQPVGFGFEDLIFIYNEFFRSKGIATEALAKSKSSKEPPKYLPSVNTEIPQAPAFSYPFTTSSTVKL
jgi:hypothetical protein